MRMQAFQIIETEKNVNHAALETVETGKQKGQELEVYHPILNPTMFSQSPHK